MAANLRIGAEEAWWGDQKERGGPADVLIPETEVHT